MARFSVETVFKAVDKITAPVSRMQSRFGRFTRSASRGLKNVQRRTDAVAKGLKKVGAVAVVAMAITGAALANVVSIGAEFEQTLVNAAAKFPGEITRGTEAFKQLEAAARQTGRTTEFTATQSAAALNFLAMAGFNAEQSIAALPQVVNLATVAQTDLQTATDIATDSLGAFGLMSKDATVLSTNLARVNNVLAKTSTSANTSLEQMFEAMKEGGPVATGAGASIETFAALTGKLADAGIKGTRAGTTLKNIFIRLSTSAGTSGKMLRRLGVATKDSRGNLLDVTKILGQLDGKLKRLGTADRAAALNEIFGKIPLAGVNVLLQTGQKEIESFRKQLEGAAGAADKMASIMRDTLQGRLKTLTSTIESVKLSIFELIKGPLEQIVTATTKWIRANEKLIAGKIKGFLAFVIKNFSTIVKVLKLIGTLVGVFLALVAALKVATIVMAAFNLVANANPIGLIALAIYGLILAIGAAVFWWDEIKAAFLSLPGPVKVAIAVLTGPIGWLVGAAALIMENWEPIKGFFVSLWSGVVSVFDAAVAHIMSIVDIVKSAASFIFDTVDKVGGILGFGDDDEDTQQASGSTAAGKLLVSPQDQIARTLDEKITRSTSEVTIKDETGRAEVTGGKFGPGLTLQASGGF